MSETNTGKSNIDLYQAQLLFTISSNVVDPKILHQHISDILSIRNFEIDRETGPLFTPKGGSNA